MEDPGADRSRRATKMTGLRRVVVTGVAGFIGANLARELIRRGEEVHGIVRATTDLWRTREILPSLHLHTADVADRVAVGRALRDVEPDVVFHLAVTTGHPEGGAEYEDLVRSGVLGTWNTLEAAAAIGVRRFVHLGSSLEYPERAVALSESEPSQPGTFRAAVKAASTLLCLGMAQGGALPVVVLRPFYVYGPWDAPSHLIPTALRSAFTGEELPLTRSTYVHDPVYVEDVVDACIRAATSDAVVGEVVNVGSGREWSNQEIVREVEAATGRKIKIRPGAFSPRPADRAHWVADIHKAKRLLGWEPGHTFRDGLEKTLRWYETHSVVRDQQIEERNGASA
ncbi:MAG: NAD-dependent epimerase/dehydratase family protein [Actinomycetota bacterium]